MEKQWSLKEIYPSFDSEEFRRDRATLDERMDYLSKWAEENLNSTENTALKLEQYIKMKNEMGDLLTRMMYYAELILSVDSTNEEAVRNLEILEGKEVNLTAPEVKFTKWLKEVSNLEEIVSSSELLKEHKFYIQEVLEKSQYILDENQEIIISKMKNTGSNAWAKLKSVVASTLLVDINIDGEDKKLPLTVIRNMAYEKDAEKRKIAYEAELKAYKKIEEACAASLNGIKGEVITVSDLRGYKSPLEKTLLDSRMDKETLDAMLEAMREYLPDFRRYFKKKAELLGHQNGLPFYELFAPMGTADMSFTYEEARDFIVENFNSFSGKLSDFAKNAFDKQWIDAEPKEGKVGGAFCEGIHAIKESRILCNFGEAFGDVVTLAHELGHGYHGSCLKEESFINSEYPMPIAETASIFCETIVKNAALKSASKEEAFAILETAISDEAQVVVDIYSRYLFETELFRRRNESSLSVNDLKEIMLNAQREAYGDGLDENYLHPYMWLNKPHYYYAEANFYNFPYAFGMLFAKGLYAEYIKRGEEFVEAYDKLLSVTGKHKIADITMMMGIDIHNKDFWRSSLDIVKHEIDEWISLA